MTWQDEQLLNKLLAMFEFAAEEHLGAIASWLLALEQAPEHERRQELDPQCRADGLILVRPSTAR